MKQFVKLDINICVQIELLLANIMIHDEYIYKDILTLSIKALIQDLLDSFLSGLQCMFTPGLAVIRAKNHYLTFLSSQRGKVRYFDDHRAVWK